MQPTNEEQAVKKLRCIQRSVDRHWVGNGFPVRTLFAYPNLGSVLSPFLLLDYAGPMEFSPTDERRGVGEHPHRGFETVTIVYEGEVEHRDSSGGGGRIGPGDVQWMTAASGLVHEEFHGLDFARRGGMFEMVQLWVNLPAKDKMTPPRYQGILNSQIPAVALSSGQGVVLKGHVRVNGSEAIGAAEVGLFDRTGKNICIDSAQDATALLLSGEPLDESIVGRGPFVMNTAEEIRQAMADYQSGKMGHLY